MAPIARRRVVEVPFLAVCPTLSHCGKSMVPTYSPSHAGHGQTSPEPLNRLPLLLLALPRFIPRLPIFLCFLVRPALTTAAVA